MLLLILASVFVMYALASVLLFFVPKHRNVLQKPGNQIDELAKQRKKVVLVSHRGGSQESFENTLEAIRKSVQLGANMIWLDVQMTRDKQLVAFSDESMLRLCGVAKKIQDYNYASLPRLLSRIKLDKFSRGRAIATDERGRRKIPLLEEVFQQFPETTLVLDIRNIDVELLSNVHYLVQKYARQEKIIWGSLDYKLNKYIFKNIKIPEFTPMGVSSKLYVFLLLGLLPFVRIRQKYFQFVLNSEALEKRAEKQLPRLYFALYQRAMRLLTPLLISHLKRRNIFCYLRVANSPRDFQLCLDYGCQGIITDRPTDLRQFLLDHDLYLTAP